MKALLATLALAFVLDTPARASEQVPARPPTVTLRPAKDRYVAGEPIGIVVTIRNPGTVPVGLRLSYPFEFQREFGLVRFDGGRAMPPLPERNLALCGPIFAFATEIPAGNAWSATLFLQNYLAPPRPGEYQVGYRFRGSYRLEGPDDRAVNQVRDSSLWADNYPKVIAEGSLTIKITAANPVELGRVLNGYITQIVHPWPDPVERKPMLEEQQTTLEAIEALNAVDGPTIIPYLAAALKARSRRADGIELGYGNLLQFLAPVSNRKEAQQIVIGLLRDDDLDFTESVLEWLTEESVPVEPGLLVRVLDRMPDRAVVPREEVENGIREVDPRGEVEDVVRYLWQVPIPSTPALQDRVARSLGLGEPLNDAHSLEVLARWNAPGDLRVRRALARLTDCVKQKRSPDLDQLIDALAAWKFPLDVNTVRGLLSREAKEAIPFYGSILAYIRTQRRDEYRVLEPQVVSLLKKDDDVVLSALKTLEAWHHALSSAEVKSLLERGGEVCDATVNYLKKLAPH